MKLGRFRQFALERKRYTIDYSQWLQAGETISTAAIAPGSGLTIDTISHTASSVVFYVSGGAGGAIYQNALTLTTSLAQTKVDSFTVEVVA